MQRVVRAVLRRHFGTRLGLWSVSIKEVVITYGAQPNSTADECLVICLADFSGCQSATALGDGCGQWSLKSYEMELFQERMLVKPDRDVFILGANYNAPVTGPQK